MGRRGSRGLERNWRRVLEQHRNSGVSVRAFCVMKRVSEASFYYWQRRLRNMSTAAAADDKIPRRRTPLVPFVPLKVQPTAAAAGVIELVHPRGHVLRLPAKFDVDSLTSILVVLNREGA